jgi:GNAT superfamily N-acetyltransferase
MASFIGMRVREADVGDAETIHGFVSQLAEFERSGDKLELSPEDYRRFLHEGGHFNALLAEDGGRAVGLALWYRRFSTWVGDYLFLEDLFVSPDYRRRGVARLLLTALGENALRLGMKRMEWMVLDWNGGAVTFYESVGAVMSPEWRLCTLDEAGLRGLTG